MYEEEQLRSSCWIQDAWERQAQAKQVFRLHLRYTLVVSGGVGLPVEDHVRI